MNALLLALAVLGGLTESTRPREFRVEVAFCEGDPLGSVADGNVKRRVEATIVVQDGRPAYTQEGTHVAFKGADGKAQKVWVGTCIEVLPLALRDGKLWIETNVKRCDTNFGPGATGLPGFTEQNVRHTRTVKPGDTFRVRVAADSPESQTWVEVTATEVAKPK